MKWALTNLSLYKDDPSILSICLDNPIGNPIGTTVRNIRSMRMTCWGWGSCSHKFYLPSNHDLAFSEKTLSNYYQNIGLDSLSRLYSCIFSGKDIWACRWVYVHAKSSSYSIIPTSSFVRNIGMDGSGQNFKTKLPLLAQILRRICSVSYTYFFSMLLIALFRRDKSHLLSISLPFSLSLSFQILYPCRPYRHLNSVDSLILFLMLPFSNQIKFFFAPLNEKIP